MADTRSLLEQIESIARDAGELLAGHYGALGRGHAERKGGRRRDLVSRADREAEQLVVDRVPPGDDVLAEEGSGRSTGAARCWVVDPLDGTVNFLHGIPFWAVSSWWPPWSTLRPWPKPSRRCVAAAAGARGAR
jgi:myo-inositol-1(or 4)-monophosphatase